jgi:hypothetical protein
MTQAWTRSSPKWSTNLALLSGWYAQSNSQDSRRYDISKIANSLNPWNKYFLTLRFFIDLHTYRSSYKEHFLFWVSSNSIPMEVGWYKDGLDCGFTNDNLQVWFNMGDYRSTLQICPLHTCEHQLQSAKVCGNLHSSRVMLAQSSENNNLWPGFVVCRSLLGATTRVSRDSLVPQFGLSPTYVWQNWARRPNAWRYA